MYRLVALRSIKYPYNSVNIEIIASKFKGTVYKTVYNNVWKLSFPSKDLGIKSMQQLKKYGYVIVG